jgi:uncharacterized membrane protein YcaP (DUF421 family)
MLEDLLGPLGSDSTDLNALQMALRAVIVFAFTLAVVRLGSKRFLGKASAFDVIVAIMLGSIMSRGITGGNPFIPVLVAGAVLVGLHWLLASLAAHTTWAGSFIKGERTLLIEGGSVREDAVQRSGLSHEDLRQAIREEIRSTDIAAVELAYLERDGTISIIPSKQEPRVFDITVDEGVKTVRIQIGQ